MKVLSMYALTSTEAAAFVEFLGQIHTINVWVDSMPAETSDGELVETYYIIAHAPFGVSSADGVSLKKQIEIWIKNTDWPDPSYHAWPVVVV